MEKLKKVLKFLKLTDDAGEVNYTTIFAIVVVVKVLHNPIDLTSAMPLVLAVCAHQYQEVKRS